MAASLKVCLPSRLSHAVRRRLQASLSRWQRDGQRNFGYRRLLYRPTFPSDLPPALRQHAEVMRHAAPEVSPHKATWKIHASRRLHEVVPELCERGAVQELVANIAYHALLVLDCKCPREAGQRAQAFRSDFFSSFSNLFEAHHIHQGAECVFGILSSERLAEVSPKMRPTRRQRLRELVIETFEEWAASHRQPFERLDAARLLDIVGAEAFLRLVPELQLNVRALPGHCLEVLFYHLVEERRDMFGALRLSLSLLPVENLSTPLGGSGWTLRRVLALIEARRSEHALRFFLANLDPEELVLEALQALRERDFDTGLLREKWAFMASLRLEDDVRAGRPITFDVPDVWPMVPPLPTMPQLPALAGRDPVNEIIDRPTKQRIYLTDGELMPFSFKRRIPQPLAGLVPPSPLRDTPWPQLAFDPDDALAADLSQAHPDSGSARSSSVADAYRAGAGWYDSMDPSSLWLGAEDELEKGVLPENGGGASGLPEQATLPLDAIHFVDSAQGLSHALTFFQNARPAFVGIDLEWSDPHPVSIIQIATASRVLILDTVNRTPLYMAVLHCLMDWLLKREDITKLFFGFPQDLVRLNMLFNQHGKSFSSSDHISSVIDLYMQRVRRVQVRAPAAADTPLGREGLLGEALAAGDFEEVRRLGSVSPMHPPRERVAERVFTVGGHHSLASMIERYLGFSMDKTLRRSNWNFRPLSSAQVIYAATDAHVLLCLEAKMRTLGVLPQRVWGCGPRGLSARGELQPAWWHEESRPDVSNET